MRKLLIAIIAGSLLLPGTAILAKNKAGTTRKAKTRHKDQKAKRQTFKGKQKSERREFRKTLKGKSPEEKKKAMKDFVTGQKDERKDFNLAIRDQNRSHLMNRIDNAKNLSPEQKTELTDFFQGQFSENDDFRTKRHADRVAYFEKVANDDALDMDAKKSALKSYLDQRRTEGKEYWKNQHQESKDKLKSTRPHDSAVDSEAAAGGESAEPQD